MIKRIIIIVFLASICFFLYFYPKNYTISGEIFGTYYQITTKSKNNVLKEINQEFELINNQMSVFVENSQINKINNAKACEKITIPPELFFVLKSAFEISQKTNGYFDITTGSIVEKFGFGTKNKTLNEKTIVGYENIILKDNTVIKKYDDIFINLSAIAKGYAVDRIANLLNKNGYKDYMINIGGEIITKGNYKSWNIGIQDPQQKHKTVVNIKLNNIAIATSGDYEKFFYNNNIKYSHIINPKTLQPISGQDLISVSVLSKSAMISDAYSTAFMAMGKELAIKFANNNKIKAIFIVKNNDKIETISVNIK